MNDLLFRIYSRVPAILSRMLFYLTLRHSILGGSPPIHPLFPLPHPNRHSPQQLLDPLSLSLCLSLSLSVSLYLCLSVCLSLSGPLEAWVLYLPWHLLTSLLTRRSARS